MEALAAYERANAVQQKLVDANPTVTDFQRDLASSHQNLGNLLSLLGKPVEAVTAYEKLQAVRQKLADANPSVPHTRSGRD